MVSKQQVQQLILGTSCALSILTYYVYENIQQNKPAPDIPVQAWNKYVAQQKEAALQKNNMSQTGPFIRVQSISAPLKGSFPLDHEGTCKLEMLKYMCCLHEQKHQNTECRERAKAYFQCRMENGLMDKDEWAKLGYGDGSCKDKQLR